MKGTDYRTRHYRAARLDRPGSVRHSSPVPTGRDWKRLASYLIDARIAAGYLTRGDFVEAIKEVTGRKVSYRTISNLENGKSVSAETIAAAERTVGWAPGSADAIRDDGQPTVIASGSPALPLAASDDPDTELRKSLRVLRRALGRDRFFELVDEMSQPTTNAEGDQTG